jgi:tetratricopeptide (TPR) repeat protein
MEEKEKDNDELDEIEEIFKEIEEYQAKLDLQSHLKEIQEELEEWKQAYDFKSGYIAFSERAKTLYRNNRSEDAIILLKEGLKYYPNHPKLICLMGFACLAQESWEAKTYFQRALEKDPKYPFAHYGLGIMELKLAENPEAAQLRYNLLMMYDPKLAAHLKERINKFLMKRS